MNRDLMDLVMVLAGLLSIPVLFYYFPELPGHTGKKQDEYPRVSIIIPARNEEENIPLILQDLRKQSYNELEIICVDDASEDRTAEIADSFGAKVITIDDKPEGWIGKSFACQTGADASSGELFLFLDADVRLGKNGIIRLLEAHEKYGCTISVQPYHKTEKLYEQFSMIFNLLLIAANGTALKKPLKTGLYGPVILMAKSDYHEIGGHEIIKSSVIDDVSLGLEMNKKSIPYELFVGDEEISFRMYGGGIKSLLQGWIKNFASGAQNTPMHILILVFLFITSLLSVPLHLIGYIFSGQVTWLMIYLLLYMIMALFLHNLTSRIGKFHIWAIILFPLPAAVFLAVFTVSMFKKIFGLKVSWKGRKVGTGNKT